MNDGEIVSIFYLANSHEFNIGLQLFPNWLVCRKVES